VVAFFVRRYGVTRDDARDLTQEVYLNVHRNIASYRGDAEWAFLEQIAHNVARNRHRARSTEKRGAMQEVQIDEFHEDYFRHEDDDYVERNERERQQAQLHKAIEQLPDSQREAMMLRLAEHSYSEIQETLKLSPDAVKTRLKDARIRLRKMLGPESGVNDLLAALPEDES
jgi:RNA polymerase sigma-70 factor (ECF subfamily)